jgi:transcriptional antiterminator RfaH
MAWFFETELGTPQNPEANPVRPLSLIRGETVAARAQTSAAQRGDSSCPNHLSSTTNDHPVGQNGAARGLKTAQSRLASPDFSLIMIRSRQELALSDDANWFCLRAQPKHEHVAAAVLRRQFGISCFAPRLRFRKATRRGAVWFIESMFPGYLFAQFVYRLSHRAVQHASGVQGFVHFGDNLAIVDLDTISALQATAGDDETVTIDPAIEVGQSVKIAEGPFQGLEAVVTRVLPAKERVKVLLDFLGRSVETEVSTPKLLPARQRL